MSGGEKRILICSPTGSGKTALTANMLGTAASKGLLSFFNVHRRELVNQSIKAFETAGVDHSIIASGYRANPLKNVHICSVQTLARRYKRYNNPKLIVWDECHHVAAGTWSKIFNHFPDAFHVGLTATPQRLDGKGLKDHFNQIVYGPSVSWLIENKYLSDYKLYMPSNISLDGVKTQMGDYKRSQVADIIDKPTITGNAIKEYKKVAMGKRAVVFCVSVAHSEHVVAQFNAVGIPAAHVDGETNTLKRDQTIREFAEGRIKVLSNVDLFGEGFDLPSMEVSILLRPTQSLGLYLQQVGRVLRTAPGKTHAIILDHVGNVLRHGLPDEEREWSLEGRSKQQKQNGPSIKVCQKCFAAQPPGRPKCKYCDTVFELSPREVAEVEGELSEVDPKLLKWKKKSEQGQAATMADLIALGKSRGYKRPEMWAKYVFNGRQRKKLRG